MQHRNVCVCCLGLSANHLNVKSFHFEWWSLSWPQGEPCVMGQKQIYMKRRPGNYCMLGRDYSRVLSTESCICRAHDFEWWVKHLVVVWYHLVEEVFCDSENVQCKSIYPDEHTMLAFNFNPFGSMRFSHLSHVFESIFPMKSNVNLKLSENYVHNCVEKMREGKISICMLILGFLYCYFILQRQGTINKLVE